MNTISARLVFENVVANIMRNFANEPNFDINNFRLTMSTIRLESALIAANTNFNFQLLANQAQPAIFPTEKRLNLQDSMIPSEVGFFVALTTGATDTAYRLQSYLNPFIFTNAAAMQALYNGSLFIAVNQVIVLKDWDLWRHWKANQTQQTAAAGAGSPIDQQDLSTDGFYPMEPNVSLVGSMNYNINIALPGAMATVDANSRGILMFRGILAQNSTVVS